MPDISEKPTLAQLLNRHHLTMPRVAHKAQVSLQTVRAMVQQRPIQPSVAQQVLSGLFRLTGVCYRLDDVDVALLPPYVIESHQARREESVECHTTTTNDRRG